MRITIDTIPHKQQRYPTVGDWRFDRDGNLEIRVSALGDRPMEGLIAIHELVEVLLCLHNGILQAEVDEFDIKFEADRKRGNDDEPGDCPDAPYKHQHCFATGIERILASALGISWAEYEAKLNAL